MNNYTIERITSSSMNATVYDLYKNGYFVECYARLRDAREEKQKLESKELS